MSALVGYTPYVGVIAIFVTNLLNGKDPVIFGDGEQQRNFVHVDDIVAGTLASLDALPGTFNLGTGRTTSVNQLAALWRRDPALRSRFLLVLGWSPFLFFSLLAGGTGEFWWADLSIVPFALLAAVLLDSLPRARSAVLVTALDSALPRRFRWRPLGRTASLECGCNRLSSI